MEDTLYLIMEQVNNSLNVKGYYSFSRLCSENNIDKKMVDKKSLPIRVGNKTILTVKIDTRI
jgi:hypothetical protein